MRKRILEGIAGIGQSQIRAICIAPLANKHIIICQRLNQTLNHQLLTSATERKTNTELI